MFGYSCVMCDFLQLCGYVYIAMFHLLSPVEMAHVWQLIYTIRLFPKMRLVHVIYYLIQPNLNPNY